MQGKDSVRFSELFKDTVETHGMLWARNHYTKNGMADWEFAFWMHATKPQI